jgi:hypothetical protein
VLVAEHGAADAVHHAPVALEEPPGASRGVGCAPPVARGPEGRS